MMLSYRKIAFKPIQLSKQPDFLATPSSKAWVRQQARRSKLTTDLKTNNAIRDIDVHPEVARLLREFIGPRKKGLLFGSRNGKPLSQSNIRNRILHPILEAMASIKEALISSGVFELLGCESRKHPKI